MASRHEIKCIKKGDRMNPYERITDVGGLNADGTRWMLTQKRAIDGIRNKKWEFYVGTGTSRVDVVIAKSPHGNEYLKTKADGEEPNNLLSLPECP